MRRSLLVFEWCKTKTISPPVAAKVMKEGEKVTNQSAALSPTIF
jgi:hypothetical protein